MQKKMIMIFSLVAIMAIPLFRAMAGPDHVLVGSWCLTAVRSDPNNPNLAPFVPVLWQISAEGNITAIAPANAFFSPNSIGPIPAVPLVRMPGIGEVVKFASNEWSANYQYFQVNPVTGALVNRIVFKNPVTLVKGDDGSDEIRTPNGMATSSWIVTPDGTVTASPITATIVGKRMDTDRNDLCTIPDFTQ